MKPKKRQKLCYNCEGEVDLDVIVCPFCAADLREEKPEQQRASFSAAAHSVKQLGGEESLYPTSRPAEPSFHAPADELVMPTEETSTERSETKVTLIATVLFSFGVQLFLLSLFMFFFGARGIFVLKWDARLWFLYLFTSAPLIYFGYRALSRVDR